MTEITIRDKQDRARLWRGLGGPRRGRALAGVVRRCFCVFICAVMLLFVFTDNLQPPAEAVALELSTATMAVGAFLLLSAGLVFITTGDMQKAVTGFLESSEDALAWCQDVASTYAEGVVTIGAAALEGGQYLIDNAVEDIQAFFSPDAGEVEIVDYDTTVYTDVNGKEVEVLDSVTPVTVYYSELPYSNNDFFEFEDSLYRYRVYVLAVDSGGNAVNCMNYSLCCDKISLYDSSIDQTKFALVSGTSRDCIVRWGLHYSLDKTYLLPYGLWKENTYITAYNNNKGLTPVQLQRCPSVSVVTQLNPSDIIPYDWSTAISPAASIGAIALAAAGSSLALDLAAVGILTDVQEQTGDLPLVASQTAILEAVGADVGTGDPGAGGGEGGNTGNENLYLSADLRDYFPFCVPFDLIALVQALNHTAEVPRFEIPVDLSFVGYSDVIEIDLEPFEPAANVIRWGVTITFILGLILITRKIIQG